MVASGKHLGFLVCAFVIALFGTWMTRIADRLADLTGFGEAMTGAIFLGGSTSLAGITTSVTAAANGHAELAISNAVGGIAAQTAFLAVADMAYRKINLEHAAASATNCLVNLASCIPTACPDYSRTQHCSNSSRFSAPSDSVFLRSQTDIRGARRTDVAAASYCRNPA